MHSQVQQAWEAFKTKENNKSRESQKSFFG